MSTRSDMALDALAHTLVERKEILKALRDGAINDLHRKALVEILKAVEECEDAWAENERNSNAGNE